MMLSKITPYINSSSKTIYIANFNELMDGFICGINHQGMVRNFVKFVIYSTENYTKQGFIVYGIKIIL